MYRWTQAKNLELGHVVSLLAEKTQDLIVMGGNSLLGRPDAHGAVVLFDYLTE